MDMAPPNFSKTTIDRLAKRARYQCSNPDCGVHTLAPNSNVEKTTVIGEAAHINGAKPGAKRFDSHMSDVIRASITNGIWLCRNCHGKIDRDETLFPVDLLHAWRKEHEDRLQSELGTRGERIRFELEKKQLSLLDDCPVQIQRIAIDKPLAWEWRLSAALLRHFNEPAIDKLKSLRKREYFRPTDRVYDVQFIGWVNERIHVMKNVVPPFCNLFDRITHAFGEAGKVGDAREIYQTTKLIGQMMLVAAEHEEVLRFAMVPEEGEELRSILVGVLGHNIERFSEFPETLDHAISLIGTDHGGTESEPTVITHKFVFDFPKGFDERFDDALARFSERMHL
ncbi:MAG: hypothetical protein ABJO27_15175 [Pseudoruegeria sp.]